MRISIYKYTEKTSPDCVAAHRVKTVEVDDFPNNQDAFAARNGGDFIEIEEQDDSLHWSGTLQADREGHLRQLFAEGLDCS